jgi:hypothetical protein
MLRTGEDEKLQARFRSLRSDEERAAPSFDRVVANAAERPTPRAWALPGLALAGLALAACTTVVALVSPDGRPPSAPAAAEASNRAVTAPPSVTSAEVACPVPDAGEQADVSAPEAEPATKKAAPKPTRAGRRPRPAPAPSCETC